MAKAISARQSSKSRCKRMNAKECMVLDRDELKDNPKLWWKKDTIIPIVKSWVSNWKADAVITFDRQGISGHVNHRAVSVAIAYVVLHHHHLGDYYANPYVT